MKKFLLTVVILLLATTIYSQEAKIEKTKTEGDLTEVTIYYENGTIMQHGFYTSKSELHGSWESYYLDGRKKCIATYNNGAKIGVWTYWNGDKITKITYKNNKVIKIEEINKDERVKNL